MDQKKLQTDNVGKWIDIQLKEFVKKENKRSEILDQLISKIKSLDSIEKIKNFRQECNKRMEELSFNNDLKLMVQEILYMENIPDKSDKLIPTLSRTESYLITSRAKSNISTISDSIDTARTFNINNNSNNSLTNEMEK